MKNSQDDQPIRYLIWVVLLLGLVLRLTELGRDSFWFDEAGVVVAAKAPNIQGTIDIAKEHVTAMPINYLQTRLMISMGDSEFWLRLPSALWGTGALLPFYFLTKRLLDHNTALISALLFAIHPFHIQYSQELRFYASGAFFYLLGTFLLFIAIQSNRWKYLTLAIITILIGSYDFPFTIFSWLNVIFIVLFSFRDFSQIQKLKLIISGLIIGIGFIPGYLIFGFETPMNYSISLQMILENLLIGLGWLPNIISTNPNVFLFGLILFVTSLFGFFFIFKNKQKNAAAILISISIQIAIILITDVSLSYFVAARQFLIFLPFSLMVSSYAISLLLNHKKPLFNFIKRNSLSINPKYKKINSGLAFFIISSIFISSIFTLTNYYKNPKSNAKQITQFLRNQFSSGDRFVFSPDYEKLLFFYYFEKIGIEIQEHPIISTNSIMNDALDNRQYNTFLVVSTDHGNLSYPTITDLGFKMIKYSDEETNLLAHLLFTIPKDEVLQ